MASIGKKRSGGRVVAASELKICDLCGALNLRANACCFTCGWRGAFNRDSDSLKLAFGRMEDELGTVCVDHVSASGAHGEPIWGQEGKVTGWARFFAAFNRWWQKLSIRQSQYGSCRENGGQNTHRPPNGLGV